MKQGILHIIKATEGYECHIAYGNEKIFKIKIPIDSDEHNGKPCLFDNQGGPLQHLQLEDGTVIFSKRKATEHIQKQKNQDKKGNQGQKKNPGGSATDMFDARNTCMPDDTRRILQGQTIDNFNLKYNKGATLLSGRREGDKAKFEVYHKERHNTRQLLANFGVMERNVSALKERNRKHLESLGSEYSEITFTPNWNMIIGLGGESVYETNMTLHHIYGIPYIPSTGIKGAVRNCIIRECFNGKEKEALKDIGFCTIFGTADDNNAFKEALEGRVVFLDAFPLSLKSDHVVADVMSPHHPDFLSSGKPPLDTDSPNIISFMACKGIPFSVGLGLHPKHNVTIDNSDSKFNKLTPLKVAKEWLKYTLNQKGIGAKTSRGYGRGIAEEKN